LPLHKLHRFEFSPEIRVSESLWAYYSWVLGTLDSFVALWCLGGYSWEPPIKLWMRAPSFVWRPGSALRNPLVEEWARPLWHKLTPENRVRPLWRWLDLCGDTTPLQRDVLPFKGGTREYIIVSSCLGYFYTRAFYLCTLHCDSLRAWSHISCYHLVTCLA
jgi:hypothetical protein